jgi:hypothetical protein
MRGLAAPYVIPCCVRSRFCWLCCSGRMQCKLRQMALNFIPFALVASLISLAGCGGGNSSPPVAPVSTPLSFSSIPMIGVSLGTQIPSLNLSQYVGGGNAPYSYSLIFTDGVQCHRSDTERRDTFE